MNVLSIVGIAANIHVYARFANHGGGGDPLLPPYFTQNCL